MDRATQRACEATPRLNPIVYPIVVDRSDRLLLRYVVENMGWHTNNFPDDTGRNSYQIITAHMTKIYGADAVRAVYEGR
jgi:hypothetical protein